jgi:hypothetical protein
VDLFVQWAWSDMDRSLRIVVDRERHTVQSPKFMLTVVWNPIGFYVLKAFPKGRKFNAQYHTNDILLQSQMGGGRPGQHGRTSCGCILIMLGHIPRKCQGIILVSIEWNRHFTPLFARFGTLGLFPFWMRQRKADRISRRNSIWTFCSYSGYSGGNPAGDLERSSSPMDGATAKMRAGRWWVCWMS